MLEVHVNVPRRYRAVRTVARLDGQRGVLGLEGQVAPGHLNANAWEPFGLALECPADSTMDVQWILRVD